MAETLAWELERRAAAGGLLSPEVEKQTVAELCRWWLDNVCPPASQERDASRLKVNVMGTALGSIPMKRVIREDIERRLREMEAADAAPSSVEHVRRVLRAVFNAAKLPHNPAAEARERSMDPVNERATLTANEVVHMLQGGRDLRRACLLALGVPDLARRLARECVQNAKWSVGRAGRHERSLPIRLRESVAEDRRRVAVLAHALPPEGPSDRAPQREQKPNRRVRQGDSLGEHGAQVGQRKPAPAAGQVDGPGIVKRHAREERVDTEPDLIGDR